MFIFRQLFNNNLISIPDSLGDLENLKELYIDANKLKTLPDTIDGNNLVTLPDSIGDLENLKELNELVILPDSMGDLKNLKILHLENNSFKTIPPSVTNLENLVIIHQFTLILYMCDNVITEIPHEIDKLKNLKYL
ncbi:hypothetical protein PIROE2DRAFT_10566 [Piromyces sp. E2]|nr:hypothetical protein PIROE2DRAFT_10566 [Piromyces sp. E2]|eukprot:OUM62990.1 hypothetical protein PIROE2DRAFT_10566 [Piromyces sp. E2]